MVRSQRCKSCRCQAEPVRFLKKGTGFCPNKRVSLTRCRGRAAPDSWASTAPATPAAYPGSAAPAGWPGGGVPAGAQPSDGPANAGQSNGVGGFSCPAPPAAAAGNVAVLTKTGGRFATAAMLRCSLTYQQAKTVGVWSWLIYRNCAKPSATITAISATHKPYVPVTAGLAACCP